MNDKKLFCLFNFDSNNRVVFLVFHSNFKRYFFKLPGIMATLINGMKNDNKTVYSIMVEFTKLIPGESLFIILKDLICSASNLSLAALESYAT